MSTPVHHPHDFEPKTLSPKKYNCVCPETSPLTLKQCTLIKLKSRVWGYLSAAVLGDDDTVRCQDYVGTREVREGEARVVYA